MVGHASIDRLAPEAKRLLQAARRHRQERALAIADAPEQEVRADLTSTRRRYWPGRSAISTGSGGSPLSW
jgi:hypothetical protein